MTIPLFYFIKQDITHYEQLKARVIHHDLLVDNLIYKVHLKYSLFDGNGFVYTICSIEYSIIGLNQ